MPLLKSKTREKKKESKVNNSSLKKIIESLDFFGSVNIDTTMDSEFNTKAKLNFKKLKEDIEREYVSFKKQYKNVNFTLTEMDTMIHDIINFLDLLESGNTLDENSFAYAYIARMETVFLLENEVFSIPFSLNEKLIEYLIEKRHSLAVSISLLNTNLEHMKNTLSPRMESCEKAIERYKILDKILKEEIETRKEMTSEMMETEDTDIVNIEPILAETAEMMETSYAEPAEKIIVEDIEGHEDYFRDNEKPLYFSFSDQPSVKITEYLKCKYLNEFSLIETAGRKKEYFVGREDAISGDKYVNKDGSLIKLEYGQGYSIGDFGNLILAGFLSDFKADEKVVIAYYDFMCNLFHELYNRNLCPGINGLSMLKKEYGTYVRYRLAEKKSQNERYCKLKNILLDFATAASFYSPDIENIACENNVSRILNGETNEITALYEKIEKEHCADEETHALFFHMMDAIHQLSGKKETDYGYGSKDNVLFIFKKISSKGIVDVSSFAKNNLQYALQCFMQVDAPVKEFGIKLGREYIYLIRYAENKGVLKYTEREKHLRHMDIGIRGEIILHYEDLIMSELEKI